MKQQRGEKMKTNTEEKIVKTVVLFLIVFLLVLGVFLIFQSFHNKKYNKISYSEDNEVHYKVFLKENNFFDTPYLEEGKTYITSLIDYLNIDFKYQIDFSEKVTGKYEYYLEASIEADKSNNEIGNYWTKDFKISDIKEFNVNNSTNYMIKENINIDYNKYNDLLNEFKKSTGVSTDSRLIIKMVINSKVKNDKIVIPIDSTLVLSMPLSELAIEGTIDTNTDNKEKTVRKEYIDTNIKYLVKRIMGVICIVMSFVLIVSITRLNNYYKKIYAYELKLKKILSTYDGIIVTLEKKPDFTKYNQVNVSNFEELIDAHSEVRMPINYYQEKRKSYFTLINGNEMYVYVLTREKKEGDSLVKE